MSIRAMIDAAGEGNAAEMERNFQAAVSEKLSNRLSEIRTDVVASMFGLQEEFELSEEMIIEYLETLSEEDLEYIESLSEEEAYELIESDIRRYAKAGAKIGAAGGGLAGAATGAAMGAAAAGPAGAIVGGALGGAAGAVGGTVKGAIAGGAAGTVRKGVRKVANLGRRIAGKAPSQSPKRN